MNILPQSMEIEKIYTHVFATDIRSLAITSASSGEGVTSLALALAQRNLLAGNSTLVIDLNLHHPSFKGLLKLENSLQKGELLEAPQLVYGADQHIVLTGITAPYRREKVLKLCNLGELEKAINELKKTYQTLIFDTSPLNQHKANNIPAERVAAACDGSLLVVLAGQITEAKVSTAMQRLSSSGTNLLGCVLNDCKNPPLKCELQREINRLRPRYNGLANWLDKRISQNYLLNMEF